MQKLPHFIFPKDLLIFYKNNDCDEVMLGKDDCVLNLAQMHNAYLLNYCQLYNFLADM